MHNKVNGSRGPHWSNGRHFTQFDKHFFKGHDDVKQCITEQGS